MPRQARLRIPGIPVHIIQRGSNRSACFAEDRDFRVYLSLLDELAPLYACPVHAYVLMTNHVHLLLTPGRVDGTSMLMKHMGQRFAQYINRKYARSGPLFEGRFRSCLVDSDAYLLTCHRYIEMNPVRAGIVDHPSRYAWSSYGANAQGLPSDIVVPHPLYISLAIDPDERRSRYQRMFDVPESAEALKRIREATHAGVALGEGAFVSSLPGSLQPKAVKRKPGRPAQGSRAERSA
jgi:putative transposase